MAYIEERRDAYADPRKVLEGVRSVLMLGVNYRTVEPIAPGAGEAIVSRYAWGDDYHEWTRERLHTLADFHRRLVLTANVRGVVDTAPLLERAYAQRAGIGWIGRNTLLINERFGSWVFLAALLTTEELVYDEPTAEDRCGTCHACLDACPSGALAEPYCVDARKCVSFLTIERRGPIPLESNGALGHRLFGCDACQEACPWNLRTPMTTVAAFQPKPGMNPVALAEVTALDEAEFRRRFRHSPFWRAGHEGIARNAAIVLSNQQQDKRYES
jgi:epoxyqueuosine reductase